jgi:hypothetical protein
MDVDLLIGHGHETSEPEHTVKHEDVELDSGEVAGVDTPQSIDEPSTRVSNSPAYIGGLAEPVGLPAVELEETFQFEEASGQRQHVNLADVCKRQRHAAGLTQ